MGGLNDFDRPLTKRGHEQELPLLAGGSRLCSGADYVVIGFCALVRRRLARWFGAKAPTAHLDEGLYEVSASRILRALTAFRECSFSDGGVASTRCAGCRAAPDEPGFRTRTRPWMCTTVSRPLPLRCLRCWGVGTAGWCGCAPRGLQGRPDFEAGA